MTVQEEIEKTIKLLNKDYSNLKEFHGVYPVYPFNTEDSANLFFSYREFIKDKKVLTVTGSGDALLDLIRYGAKDITCFDSNVLAKHIAELKLAFWKAHLGEDNFKKFFMGEHCCDEIMQYDLFMECRPYLRPETLYYFECVYDYIKKHGIKFTNDESRFLYQQYDSFIHFPVQNRTVGNSFSYMDKENARVLEDILIDPESIHVNYLDANILDVDKKIGDDFYFMYLSNIFEFTSTFIDYKRLRMRLEKFKSYVSDDLYPHLSDGGVLVAGYLKGSDNSRPEDIYRDKSKYPSIFSENEGYLVDDVYGCKGKAIIKANKEVIKKRKLDMYDFF